MSFGETGEELAALKWLAFFCTPGARQVEKIIRKQRAEIERLRAGIVTDGVTREEWEIIMELRKTMEPQPKGPTT